MVARSELVSDEKQNDLAQHILPAAGTMLGICTTLIGLVKAVEPHTGSSHVDEYASVAAVLFLFSATASYSSLRFRAPSARRRLERAADLSFLIGLVSLAAISVLFAYEVI